MIQNNQEKLLHLQQKAGTDMDFFLAVKNNVQKSDQACNDGKVLMFDEAAPRTRNASED